MPSLRGRLIYWLLKVQRTSFDPNKSVQQQRSWLEKQVKHVPMPRHVAVQPSTIGEMPAEWLRPINVKDDRVALYLHGGGFTMGSCNTHRTLGARLAIASQTPVLMFEYRLAPEFPFPAALGRQAAEHDGLWAQRLHGVQQPDGRPSIYRATEATS